jgi:hypothetical protein
MKQRIDAYLRAVESDTATKSDNVEKYHDERDRYKKKNPHPSPPWHKEATVKFDEEGEHTIFGADENRMCRSCNATNQATDRTCRNCKEVLK